MDYNFQKSFGKYQINLMIDLTCQLANQPTSLFISKYWVSGKGRLGQTDTNMGMNNFKIHFYIYTKKFSYLFVQQYSLLNPGIDFVIVGIHL